MSEDKCKCDFRTKMCGDGCRYCNPQDYIDHLHDALDAREWQDLTDDEAIHLIENDALDRCELVEAVESLLKAKNG